MVGFIYFSNIGFIKGSFDMRIYTIDDIKKNRKILRERALDFTKEDSYLIEGMKKKLIESGGIGLAGNQIGELKRIIVLNLPEEEKSVTFKGEFPYVLLNPTWEKVNNFTSEHIEGCLSLPKRTHKVKRYEKIKVKGLDETFKEVEIVCDGLMAYCIQHECDHLDGKLICDIKK